VGAQGGDAQATVRAAWRGTPAHTSGPIAVNASRSIIYASAAADFAQAARREAIALRLSLQAARVFGV
jgi:orotidine-5'-phosphate decarboxylase